MTRTEAPTVSVIVPTHNRADLLPRAVDSVLAQTYGSYEILIVDDCSSDGTQDVIAGFADPRIRSFRHERNRGQSAAINTGIAHARGEYVGFLDDDDEWLPGKLAGQVALLDASSPKVALVYGWMDRVDDSDGRLIPAYRSTVEGDIFESALALSIPGPTIVLLLRSSVAREVGGMDESLLKQNDVDLICRVSQRYHAAVLREVVARAHFGHHSERIGDDNPRNLSAAAASLRSHMTKFAGELDERPRAHAAVLRRLAAVEMMLGNRRVALAAVASAFRLDPLGVSRALLRNRGLTARILGRFLRSRSESADGPSPGPGWPRNVVDISCQRQPTTPE